MWFGVVMYVCGKGIEIVWLLYLCVVVVVVEFGVVVV